MSVLAGRAVVKNIQKDAVMKQVFYHKSLQKVIWEDSLPLAVKYDRAVAPRRRPATRERTNRRIYLRTDNSLENVLCTFANSSRVNPITSTRQRRVEYSNENFSANTSLRDSGSYNFFIEKDFKLHYLYKWSTPRESIATLYSSSGPNNTKSDPNDRDTGGSPEQLEIIKDKLAENLPKLFYSTMDYTFYHPNVVFINNITGKSTVGIYPYVKQVSWLRALGHLKFAYVSFEILKITTRAEDSSVIVRWRVKGISGFKALFMFWKIKLWKMREIFRDEEIWYDAISTFYVGSDGLIHKHIVDKMQPDEENSVDKIIPKTPIAAKLALLLGLLPKGQIYGIPSIPSVLTSSFEKCFNASPIYIEKKD